MKVMYSSSATISVLRKFKEIGICRYLNTDGILNLGSFLIIEDWMNEVIYVFPATFATKSNDRPTIYKDVLNDFEIQVISLSENYRQYYIKPTNPKVIMSKDELIERIFKCLHS